MVYNQLYSQLSSREIGISYPIPYIIPPHTYFYQSVPPPPPNQPQSLSQEITWAASPRSVLPPLSTHVKSNPASHLGPSLTFGCEVFRAMSQFPLVFQSSLSDESAIHSD